MKFRLVLWDTPSEFKYDAERRFEYLGDALAIWSLWFMLTKQLQKIHVEVYSLDGVRQYPENGLSGLVDYNL